MWPPTPDVWSRISGPVVSATDLPHTRLFDVVRVGVERLLGEVIKIEGELVVMQVFEDTTGLQVGEPVLATGEPLYAELGPGLLGCDPRRHPATAAEPERGRRPVHRQRRGPAPPRPRPSLGLPAGRRGRGPGRTRRPPRIGPGGRAIEHRILVPAGIAGVVTAVRSGPATILDPVVDIGGHPVAMMRRWPLRQRPPGREPAAAHRAAGHRPADP